MMVGSMNWKKNKSKQRISNQIREQRRERTDDVMLANIRTEKINEQIRSLTEEQKFEIYGRDYNSFGPFGPTRKQVLSGLKPNEDVECIHCYKQFKMLDMVFEVRFGGSVPFWYCPNEGCNGAGYGFDIHSLTNKRLKNRKIWCEELSKVVENDGSVQGHNTINITKQKEHSRKRKRL